jgi:hypothetical protein
VETAFCIQVSLVKATPEARRRLNPHHLLGPYGSAKAEPFQSNFKDKSINSKTNSAQKSKCIRSKFRLQNKFKSDFEQV